MIHIEKQLKKDIKLIIKSFIRLNLLEKTFPLNKIKVMDTPKNIKGHISTNVLFLLDNDDIRKLFRIRFLRLIDRKYKNILKYVNEK